MVDKTEPGTLAPEPRIEITTLYHLPSKMNEIGSAFGAKYYQVEKGGSRPAHMW